MATNEILPFASTNTGTNLLTQAEYAADAQRTIGHQPGIARSKLENKALRQASLMSSGLAEFIADYQANNVTDSLTPQQVADYLYQAIQAIITVPDYVPSGSVIYVARSTAPTGYIKANGAEVSRTTYASLFSAIGTTFGAGNGTTTFNLPDLRGVFPRGWDDGRGVDSGRAFGSSQLDAFQGFDPVASMAYSSGIGSSSSYGDMRNKPYYNHGGGTTANININWDATAVTIDSQTLGRGYICSDDVNGTPRVAAETRPRNLALLACIKF